VQKKAYIVSYPRSGNTWVRLLLEYSLGFQSTSVYPEEERSRSDSSGSIPHTIKVVTGNDQHLVRPPSVPLIKSHDLSIDGSDPVIYVLRDGRDATVSYWRYLQEFESRQPEEFSSFLRDLRQSGNWWADHVHEWLVRDKRHPKLVVRFEDLLTDQGAVLKRMLDFLGLVAIRQFSEFQSEIEFSNLKREMPAFFRTGRAGIWREVFSKEDEEFFLRNDHGLLEKLGYLRSGGPVANGTRVKGQKRTEKQQLTAASCWCGGATASSEAQNYLRCQKCGTFIAASPPAEDELRTYYSREYWPSLSRTFGYPSIEERATLDFQDRIPLWYRILELFAPPPARLLEIGAAHGGFLGYSQQRGYAEVVGIEPDPEVAEFGRKKFGLTSLMSGFFPELSLPHACYDVIAMFDVLEHLIDPLSSLNAVAALLAENGMCLIQTPCYRGEGGKWDQFDPEHRHTFIFNRESAKLLFERTGFKVLVSLPGYFLHDVIFVIAKPPTTERFFQQRFSDSSFLEKLHALYDQGVDLRSVNEYEIRRIAEERARSLVEKEQEIAGTQKAAAERARALLEKEDEIAATQKAAAERTRALLEKEAEITTTQEAAEERARSLVEKEQEIAGTQKALIEKEDELRMTQKAAEERARALLEKEEMIRSLHDVAEERSRALHQINEELERIKRHWVYRIAVRIKCMLEKLWLKASS